MMVTLSPGGQTIAAREFPSERIFVGTSDGIFTFVRKNGSWIAQGHALPGEHISALLYEPLSQTLFAGAYAGEYEGAIHIGGNRCSLFASRDLGKSWEKRSEGIRHLNLFTLNFRTAGQHVRLYAGTEPAHLYLSDDLGKSWAELPSLCSVPSVAKWTFPAFPHLGHVKHIAFYPAEPQLLYVAIEVGGLLKSVDGGATFKELHGIDPDVHKVLVSPSNPQKLLISGLGGVCLSEDGGASWQNLTTPDSRIGYPDALLMHPREESLLFMAGSKTNPGTWRTTQTADACIARSRDGGRNWKILDEGLPAEIRGNIEAMSMDVWKDGFALFAGTTDGDVFYSEDEGDHWGKIAQGLPPVSKVGHFRHLCTAAHSLGVKQGGRG